MRVLGILFQWPSYDHFLHEGKVRVRVRNEVTYLVYYLVILYITIWLERYN